MAWWRRGYAADCKSVYPGSIPGQASTSMTEPTRALWRASRQALTSLGVAIACGLALFELRLDPNIASLTALAAALVLAVLAFGSGSSRLGKGLWLAAALLAVFAILDTEAALLFRPKVTLDGAARRFVVADPLLGYAPRPGARAHVTWARGGRTIYDARYTIGPDGFRLTRSNPNPTANTTAFLGDSYTYGDGLNDGDTLPQQYAAVGGYRQKVINAAFSGYGTHQVLRLLQSDRLDGRLGAGRRTFVYPMIEEHLRRLDGRGPLEWMGTPRYVLDHGQPRLAGRFHPGLEGALLGVASSSALFTALTNQSMLEPSAQSPELFGAMVQQARDLARTRYAAGFLVLLWDEPILRDVGDPERASRRAAMVDRIAAELRRRGVPFWRISALIPDYPSHMAAYVIAGSGHPSAALNHRLAIELSRRLPAS